MNLPEQFEKNMINLLGEEEFAEYKKELEKERRYGFRANTLKITAEEFEKIAGDKFGAYAGVPWCPEGFYYKDSFPGRHPYYHAGIFYIQEPSAMYPGSVLRPLPGENVLDICAAPGGKTTQLAATMQGSGLLVSNDINEERVKALVKNVEMCGARNVIVTNEDSSSLAAKFPMFFDKILVDAPCSGEGMFRKDDEAVKSWENFKSDRCREMQDMILDDVHKMLKPGGYILYSTCTFAPKENEQTVCDFMDKYGCYELIGIEKPGGICDAIPSAAETGVKNHAERAARLWPHKINGEGHFTALIHKKEDAPCDFSVAEYSDSGKIVHKKSKHSKKKDRNENKTKSYSLLSEAPASVKYFYEANMTVSAPVGSYFLMGTNLYYLPCNPPDLDSLKIARAGVFMGSLEHADFRPSQPFAMIHSARDFKIRVSLKSEGSDVSRYLKGETLSFFEDAEIAYCGETLNLGQDIPDGYAEVDADGFILGLGKFSGGVLKNLYPKGWRRTR